MAETKPQLTGIKLVASRAVAVVLGISLLGALAFLVLLAYGSMQPAKYSVTGSIFLRQPPEVVFGVLEAWEQRAENSSRISRVERMADRAGKRVFRQTVGENWTVFIIETERVRPSRIAATMESGEGEELGGFVWELKPESGGTRLYLTDNGINNNPLSRAIVRMRGLDSGVKADLAELQRRFEAAGINPPGSD